MAATARKNKKVETPIDPDSVVKPVTQAVKTTVQIVDSAKERSSCRTAPDRTAIALRAWEIWQSEGCPHGKDLEHWLRAEQELRRGSCR